MVMRIPFFLSFSLLRESLLLFFSVFVSMSIYLGDHPCKFPNSCTYLAVLLTQPHINSLWLSLQYTFSFLIQNFHPRSRFVLMLWLPAILEWKHRCLTFKYSNLRSMISCFLDHIACGAAAAIPEREKYYIISYHIYIYIFLNNLSFFFK
jgi:hypothetical protein